jgi:hypothetical protein
LNSDFDPLPFLRDQREDIFKARLFLDFLNRIILKAINY